MTASASEILDREFLSLRAKVLDVAAALDRLDRAEGSVEEEDRLRKIRQGLEMLLKEKSHRAEQVQMLFSLPYDPQWQEAFASKPW